MHYFFQLSRRPSHRPEISCRRLLYSHKPSLRKAFTWTQRLSFPDHQTSVREIHSFRKPNLGNHKQVMERRKKSQKDETRDRNSFFTDYRFVFECRPVQTVGNKQKTSRAVNLSFSFRTPSIHTTAETTRRLLRLPKAFKQMGTEIRFLQTGF